MSYSTCLACKTTTTYVYKYIELINSLGCYERLTYNYFGLETLKLIVRSPLVLLGLEGKYDVVVRVSGGGVSGQAGAIRHGLSRALLQQSDENRTVLKKAGFLTRDPRMKERKKYGLKAARRAPQFSKR